MFIIFRFIPSAQFVENDGEPCVEVDEMYSFDSYTDALKCFVCASKAKEWRGGYIVKEVGRHMDIVYHDGPTV